MNKKIMTIRFNIFMSTYLFDLQHIRGLRNRPHLIQCTPVRDILVFQYSRIGINTLSIELLSKAIVLHSTLQSQRGNTYFLLKNFYSNSKSPQCRIIIWLSYIVCYLLYLLLYVTYELTWLHWKCRIQEDQCLINENFVLLLTIIVNLCCDFC